MPVEHVFSAVNFFLLLLFSQSHPWLPVLLYQERKLSLTRVTTGPKGTTKENHDKMEQAFWFPGLSDCTYHPRNEWMNERRKGLASFGD